MLLIPAALMAGDFRVGTARADITPELPVWLSGYAVRTHPAHHILERLWAKALSIDDGQGGRIVIVTTDLLGLPPEIVDEVSRRCGQQFGIKRAQLWLNSSHTHSGPAVWPNLRVIFDFDAVDQRRAEDYARRLTEQLVAVAGESLKHTFPARIYFGQGEAAFAINRRLATLRELHPGHDFPAPVDHSVPVIEIKGSDGAVRVVLFGYACHNTTITGQFYEVAGDYAGYAQESLERRYPGAQAMFAILCAGDQNPSPRSQLELAQHHGEELAQAVENILARPLVSLGGPIRTAFQTTELPFARRTRADFEAEAQDKDIYHQRRAKLMLAALDRGTISPSVKGYPVQAIRFGSGLTILTLGGEVVVDYALRAKREYAATSLVVAGYSNGVMCYIPSDRVLSEGGYEASESMIYYAQPGPFASGVENRIFQCIHATLRQVGAFMR